AHGATSVATNRSREDTAVPDLPLADVFRGHDEIRLAQHRSHQSHQSHGSHRSSSGGTVRPAPSPAPTYRLPSQESNSSPPSSVLPSATLGDSDKSAGEEPNMLKRVQAMLAVHGYYAAEIDGIDGVATRAAITRFQADRGLTITGTVTP